MKRYLIILFVFLTNPIFAQKRPMETKKLSSFGILLGSKTFYGDNFLTKTYSNRVSFNYDFNKIIYQNFGAGVFYRSTQAKLTTTEFVGNSTFAKITEYGFYINYLKEVGLRWHVLPKIGVSHFALRNRIISTFDNEKYNYFTYGQTFYFSPEIHYLLNKDLRLCANAEYGFINLSSVKGNNMATGTNYNSADQLNLGIGIKIGF